MVLVARIRSPERRFGRYRTPVRIRRHPIELSFVEVARALRRRAAAAERTAWRLLQNRQMLGLKFRRQHPINGFIVDFYCAELRLVLELDGSIHEEIAQSSYDEARTTWLEAHRFRVERMRSRDVSETHLKRLLQKTMSQRSPSPHCGEGVRG